MRKYTFQYAVMQNLTLAIALIAREDWMKFGFSIISIVYSVCFIASLFKKRKKEVQDA